MKRKTTLVLFAGALNTLCAQTYLESDSYGLDQYLEKCTDIPVVREINGGTVFKITYEPEESWNNSMKGAFEYACKIWEEQLPSTLPLNIHAKIGPLRGTGNGNLLSRVLPTSHSYSTGGLGNELTCCTKFRLLEEYNYSHYVTLGDSIRSEDFFNQPDITITYNQNMLGDFSFSLYSTPVDKYDFVTVVLRDIAKGLGFISGFTADTNMEVFHSINRIPTYYEEVIQNAIGTDNPHVAYINSTQGQLPLSVQNYGNLKLYAPHVWKNGVSLNYFIPDSTKRITELLAYDFGRGSVIRNITDRYHILFKYLHGWKIYNITTGFVGRDIDSEGSTENLLNYNGSIVVGTDQVATANWHEAPLMNIANDNPCDIVDVNNFQLYGYLRSFDYKYPDEDGTGSWLVFLLRKDGTWELVYRQYTGNMDVPLCLNMSNLPINSASDQYQRTCDGYLRSRITHYKQQYDYLYKRDKYIIKNHYYVIDYLPQRVMMELDSRSFTETVLSKSTADDFTQQVRINIKGLEGVDRIVVEQYDEGNDMPVKYEISDFKKGYFTATVDKELYTEFVIYAYNKNGSTKSDSLIIPPLSSVQEPYDIRFTHNSIELYLKSRMKQNINDYYCIYSLDSAIPILIKRGEINAANSIIDIAHLQSGRYVLSIKSKENKQNVKFIKR